MKKFLALSLAVIMIFCLTACGGKSIRGTWKYSIGEYTSIAKFKANDTVVWTLKTGTKENTIEGIYHFDEEEEEVTVTFPGFGTNTYDVSFSSPEQIDFMDLPHRR